MTNNVGESSKRVEKLVDKILSTKMIKVDKSSAVDKIYLPG